MNKFFTFLFLFFLVEAHAQMDVPMEVIRTKAVDRYSPVTNIFIDADGSKWVGNHKGLFQVFSPEQGSPAHLKPGEWSLLQTPWGNYDLRLPFDEITAQMGEEGKDIQRKSDWITAATFDARRSELWLGTRKSGLFQFKTQPVLKLMQRHHMGNSKLSSNQVNALFLDDTGRLWIGTAEGCVYGKDGKWNLEEKYFSIQAFAQNSTDVWVMGNDLLWKVDARNSWLPIDIDQSLSEGEVAGIAFDGNGQLWIASEIISRFDPASEEYKIFGPAQEFTSQDVSCIAVDADNAVWIGTNDKGLYLIQKADAIALTCLIDKNLSCGAGAKDASLKVIADGGTPPYTYQWAGGLSGTNPSNLGPGEYALTVTDSKGKSRSAKISIPDPNLILTAAQDQPASESGANDGKASVAVQGGRPGFIFKWDNGEVTATASKLGEGTHTVTVTDQTGCTASASVAISRQVGKLAVSISQTKDLNCPGGKDAVLSVEVTGGKEPFTFDWTDGNSPASIQSDFILKIKNTDKPNVSEFEVSAVSAGHYNLSVKDATGQFSSGQIEVKAPQPITVSAKVEAPAGTGKADGKASAKVSGGSGSFSFKWDNGEETATAVRLAPGEHSLTVTDANGCTATTTANISENILPLSLNISKIQEIKCAGERSGALQAEVSGGKGPFKFTWSDGAQGEQASGLGAGDYSLTLTDVTGQTKSAMVQLTEPQPINLAVTKIRPSTTEKTNNGKATAVVSGGTGSYKIQWDNRETAETAIALPVGRHSVTVTDANGCQAVADFETGIRIIPELTAETLRSGEVIKLEKIYFQPDSTRMEASSIPTVDELYEFLEENPGIVIEVGGHTNNIPSHEFCDQLSAARAKSVAQYLVEKGISAKRITYKGYGKRNPIATNTTPEGRAKNQRVEIKIVRLDGD